MSNPLIRASDHYVLLEPDSKEKIVNSIKKMILDFNFIILFIY